MDTHLPVFVNGASTIPRASLEYRKIVPVSVCGAGDGWHIESEALGLSGVIEVSADRQHLTICENHYDGFNRHYVRAE